MIFSLKTFLNTVAATSNIALNFKAPVHMFREDYAYSIQVFPNIYVDLVLIENHYRPMIHRIS